MKLLQQLSPTITVEARFNGGFVEGVMAAELGMSAFISPESINVPLGD